MPPPTSFCEHFSSVPDPRVQGRSDHLLLDILAIAILATICGADGWDDIAFFGECKKKWLATFLDLPKGTPSADTFRRVFSALDPAAFRDAFVAWMQALVGSTDGKLIAIDGKTARRSSGPGSSFTAALAVYEPAVSTNWNALLSSHVAQPPASLPTSPHRR